MLSYISKYATTLVLVVLLLMICALPMQAQCSMCRSLAEESIEGQMQSQGGINTGILYMLSIPYACLLVLGIYWWYTRGPRQNTKRATGKV